MKAFNIDSLQKVTMWWIQIQNPAHFCDQRHIESILECTPVKIIFNNFTFHSDLVNHRQLQLSGVKPLMCTSFHLLSFCEHEWTVIFLYDKVLKIFKIRMHHECWLMIWGWNPTYGWIVLPLLASECHRSRRQHLPLPPDRGSVAHMFCQWQINTWNKVKLMKQVVIFYKTQSMKLNLHFRVYMFQFNRVISFPISTIAEHHPVITGITYSFISVSRDFLVPWQWRWKMMRM